MSIWQWILVLFPVLNFGFSTAGQLKENKTNQKKWAAVVANAIILFVSEFILFKAGVLIII